MVKDIRNEMKSNPMQSTHSYIFESHTCRYDVYLTKEPSVFESMALVHSRVRQVVFGIENNQDGGLGGTGETTAVHCLPGTNHRYRAFKCIANDQSELYQSCMRVVRHVSNNNNED
jgi:tRNA(Arg) A34 adenosine deaminase TadA